MRIILVAAVLALSACGTVRTVPEVRTIHLAPPPELLACEAEPRMPAQMESLLHLYEHFLRVALAGDHCRSRLRAVRDWAAGAQ